MGTIQVLLVESDTDIRHLFSLFLEKERLFDVFIVDDAKTALTTLERQTFDILVTGWHLPGLPGHALIQEAQRRYPHMKTVLMGLDPAVRMTARAIGADGCLMKLDIRHLSRLITDLCASRGESL